MGLRTYYIALLFNSNTLHEEIRGEGSLGPFAIEHLQVLLHDSNLLLLHNIREAWHGKCIFYFIIQQCNAMVNSESI